LHVVALEVGLEVGSFSALAGSIGPTISMPMKAVPPWPRQSCSRCAAAADSERATYRTMGSRSKHRRSSTPAVFPPRCARWPARRTKAEPFSCAARIYIVPGKAQV
jgi:hypothetical protein